VDGDQGLCDKSELTLAHKGVTKGEGNYSKLQIYKEFSHS